ncbi:MAG: twin-arginine translocase subunit TatC [Thermoplasmata archaeon]|nr:twin-arginine translocase subunit TatC [Thermoplasmata archaeon]
MGDLDRILSVLSEARRRLLRIALVLGPIFGFLLTFELRPITLRIAPFAVPLAYPYPSLFHNVAAQVFLALKVWALPPGVALLNLGVGDSVVVQLEIGALLTVILGMPWIIHEVGAFLIPALRGRERDLLRRIGIPATLLFAAGTLVGLLFLTPLTFRLLFDYVAAMGAAPVLGIESFVEFALLYSLAFGIAFELPVFVYGLTRLGVVRASSWKKHWRGAVIGSLVFGMIVTPDNSGITMLLVAAPMIALYLGGVWFAGRWDSARASPPALAVGV